jgi:hypothetical protein
MDQREGIAFSPPLVYDVSAMFEWLVYLVLLFIVLRVSLAILLWLGFVLFWAFEELKGIKNIGRVCRWPRARVC